MDVGRLVGRLILTVLDAMAAGVVAGFAAFFFIPVLWVDDVVIVAVTVAGTVAGIVLAIALVLARRGERPFPATRLAIALFKRTPVWGP